MINTVRIPSTTARGSCVGANIPKNSSADANTPPWVLGKANARLDAGHAIGKKVAQEGRQKNAGHLVYLTFTAQKVYPVCHKGACYRHGKGIGTQSGQAAVGQKDCLE